jgi:hypothetical protein
MNGAPNTSGPYLTSDPNTPASRGSAGIRKRRSFDPLENLSPNSSAYSSGISQTSSALGRLIEYDFYILY